ncbi:E3 ubiquitin-protein ligase MARCH8 [Orchesella cincta]|uniref:E3 ubiquitin-protein ligase MARCH8 n=1 Tax=Orchesella cincta TaxID=48709 RepID=A0A1D2NIE8_ORCCI|nr:E3 ubiquitin-protein ligase MARCH8 [Orchesella cincta]
MINTQASRVASPVITVSRCEEAPDHELHFSDVCRICHCGPNTLATPTPQTLTPVCSPKHIGNVPAIAVTIVPCSKKPPPDYNLISPCVCSGSLKFVHQCCLQHWIRASNNTACELCKHPYELRSRFKPIWSWESLPMSPGEKKRIVCSALFHLIALACVIWSLYVLIDRTVEELTHSDLEWQFWTKIIVEAIGCLGAGILTYVWGKSYVSLVIKWVAFNKSFVILGKDLDAKPITTQPELIQLIKR